MSKTRFVAGARAAVFATVTFGMITAAQADPTRDALEKFGLLGTWAADCKQKPSGRNPWQTYRIASSGKPTRVLTMKDGSLDGTFAMTNVKLMAPDRLAYRDTRTTGTLYFDVVLVRRNDRVRSVSSVSSDGKVLIRDGKFVDSGAPTLEFERCPVRQTSGRTGVSGPGAA